MITEYSKKDFLRSFKGDESKFREWAWTQYDEMRKQRDLALTRQLKFSPRVTGGKRKCPMCACREFRGPRAITGDKPALQYECMKCAHVFVESVGRRKESARRVNGKGTRERILDYLRKGHFPEGCRAIDLSEALKIPSFTVGSQLRHFLTSGEVERPEPGLYKLKAKK